LFIVDLNQVMLSNLMMQLGNHTNAQLEEQMVRHMVLNALRSFKVKFGQEFGEMVIACDNTNYWRKKIFPYYKANRKKNIANSELDWKAIFECLNKIRSELKEYFPYTIIDVESSEADDIIATLIKQYCADNEAAEPILILSGDKDFVQLHKYKNVRQYDPVRKKYITHENPDLFLKEHILKGDSSDGIPNILSGDNCFVVGDRQKPLTQKKIDSFISTEMSSLPENILRNYHRNEQLIDLNFIPEEISTKIIDQYKVQAGTRDKSKLMKYFIDNKLKNLMDSIGEF